MVDGKNDTRDGLDVRPDSVRVFGVLFFVSGNLTLAVGLLTWRWPVPGYRPVPLILLGAYSYVGTALILRFPHWFNPTVQNVIVFSSIPVVVVFQVFFIGPLSFAPVSLLWIILFANGFLSRRQALFHTACVLAALAVIFSVQPGWTTPVGYFVFLGGTLVFTAWLVNQLVARAESHAEAERQAHIEVAKLNQSLEARVTEQVDELSRLDRLRRFLPPSVAEAVVAPEGQSRLAPHRAQIAAVFCDLRGFTAFSSEAEPEDVTSLLERFHSLIGPLVERYEATVGGFAGDGVALYFNDPIPCPDPAVRAVRLALDLEEPMGRLTTEWRQLGFEVGYGVGIALGYATLGVIGIEHRREYTAIGSVMNLASRLSDEAGPSEILLDQRASAAVQEQIRTEPIDELTLKGFARPVQAYRVAGLTGN